MMITPTPTLIRFLREMAAQTMKKDDKVSCALGEAADRLESFQKSLNNVDEEIAELNTMISEREEWLMRKDALIRHLKTQINELRVEGK